MRFISLHIKPALKGEVGFAKQKPEGLKKERGFACYRQPLSQTFGLPAPRSGSLSKNGFHCMRQPRSSTQKFIVEAASEKKARHLACFDDSDASDDSV